MLHGRLLGSVVFCVAVWSASFGWAQADGGTRVPSFFSDHMVLQREMPVRVWGWDNPGTSVSVTLGEHQAQANAGDDGAWSVELPALAAGGPHELTIAGSKQIKIADILVGEVWICSGQSNMEWTVSASDNSQDEIAQADFPAIRHFKVHRRPADQPQSDLPGGGWQVASPTTVGDFTAAGYFFARALHRELQVPIGIVGTNWGGTRIEPWTPPVGFQQVPKLADIAGKLDSFPEKNDKGEINHQSPLALYNGMIHPLIKFPVRGAIWYQGESNVGEGMLYLEKMKALIGGWRAVWNQPEMPFYFVQLAPFKYNRGEALPQIWEAQTAALEIPHTGMAVTYDIGNFEDIHPRNKQDVGKRLALWALAKTYGKRDLVYSGPLLKSAGVDANRVTVRFEHAAGLKTRDGAAPTEVTIAGEDGKFVAAQAKIDGEQLVCWSDAVAHPTQVRLGWTENANPNLVNGAGLPASPFIWRK